MKKIVTLLIGGLLLATGGASGFFIAKSMYKRKYQEYADQEVEAVKKVYEKHYGVAKEPEKKQSTPLDKPFRSVPSFDVPTQKKYIDYAKSYSAEDPNVLKPAGQYDPIDRKTQYTQKEIYILTPEEFRESAEQASTLFYYKDGVLADDDYNIIKNPEEIIGPDALKSFGRYEDDAVYVRNEILKKDYEILLDNRNYIDVSPHGSGVPSDD